MKFLPVKKFAFIKIAAVVICAVTFCLAGCKPAGEKASTNEAEPLPVIFETDMGNDVDDALALDMLYKYIDKGRINLLAISNNKNSNYSIPFLKIMNNWYGYPNIPLGNVVNPANSQGDAVDYAQAVSEYTKDGQKVFQPYAGDTAAVANSVDLYRRLLSAQPDSSVVMISVGFSTNIAQLLDSKPDNWSDLGGKDLVAKKVKSLCMMAGNFNGKLNSGEYNVIKDTLAAGKVFADWPTPIVTSPFEVGIAILYPAASIENDFKWADHNPLVEAYKSYQEMPYDRPTWDLTAVLYAVEGSDGYFGISNPGTISLKEKGITVFKEDAAGKHRYLTVDSVQVVNVKNRFVQLITRLPAKHEKK